MILAHLTLLNGSLLVLFVGLAITHFLGWIGILEVDSPNAALAWSMLNLLTASISLITIIK